MSAAAPTIPFEGQSDSQARRDCGAVCLSMVYRSLGREVPQAEIWPAIASRNRRGSPASTTHLMVRDALARGFAAVAFQARDPLRALHLCREYGARAILSHRLAPDSPEGHYTVLVDMDERDVVVHDPLSGPDRRLSHAELLDLWQPRVADSEILGNLLIGIAAEPGAAAPCTVCHAAMLSGIPCPRCGVPVGLAPGALLGCTNNACAARIWSAVCCPSCDCVFTFSVAEAGAGGARVLHAPENGRPASPPAADPFQLGAVFAGIDKFIEQMLSLPGVADHPEINRQFDFLREQKDKLKLAQTEALANQAVSRERLTKLEQLTKQNEQAHRQRVEEASRPSPPLDGDALRLALLKNLGFTD